MSSKKTATDIPQIEEVKLSTLVIDEALSGRTKREIAANAKSLAPTIEAFGGWDAHQPGEYFERDGKKHLLAGFTRVAAADIAGIKTGYFVKVDDNPAQLRTACIRTNLGKPISQYEQGRIYAAMRDGGDAEKAKVGEEVLAPMTTKDIADEMGVSRQHIEACIGIFEETADIAQLIVDGVISPNIAVRARQMVKADGKRLQMLKAAVKQAQSEGKEVATMKHLDAVKLEFVPLKAVKPDKPSDAPPADETPAKKSKKGKADDEPPASPPQAQSSLDLGAPAKDAKGKKELPQNEAYANTIDMWAKERGVVISEADRDNLVDALISLPF